MDARLSLRSAQEQLAAVSGRAESLERAAAADVVLVNDGTAAELVEAVRNLWERRLAPMNEKMLETGE